MSARYGVLLAKSCLACGLFKPATAYYFNALTQCWNPRCRPCQYRLQDEWLTRP